MAEIGVGAGRAGRGAAGPVEAGVGGGGGGHAVAVGEQERPEPEGLVVRLGFAAAGEDVEAVVGGAEQRVERQLDGHVREAHALLLGIAALAAPGAGPPAQRVRVEGRAALRADQGVRLEVGEGRLAAFVVPGAGAQQQRDDVRARGGAAAQAEGPAVAEAAAHVALVVVLGRLEVPGEGAIGRRVRRQRGVEALGGRVVQLPRVGEREVAQVFGAGGEADEGEVDGERAFAVDHVGVAVSRDPAAAAQVDGAGERKSEGVRLAVVKDEVAGFGAGFEAARDADAGAAGGQLLFEGARAAEAAFEGVRLGDGLAGRVGDRHGAGGGRAARGVGDRAAQEGVGRERGLQKQGQERACSQKAEGGRVLAPLRREGRHSRPAWFGFAFAPFPDGGRGAPASFA